MIQRLLALLLVFGFVMPAGAQSFSHQLWDQLLKTHVVPVQAGVTQVDYEGFAQHKDQLNGYLAQLSDVSQAQFDGWGKRQQLAFLINAYNAWTVAFILTQWPEIHSIKDLGGWFTSPWKKELAQLLGQKRSLDNIEHDLIRGSGRYNDPRIHFAVNCASIGCPALRAEAYTAEQLDAQLDRQTELFLQDKNRNRVEGNQIYLSSIFKWYRDDFEKGWKGFYRLEDFLIVHRDALGLDKQSLEKLQLGQARIKFLDYDWQLNGKK